MPTKLTSSAPHIHPASSWTEDLKDWGLQPNAVAGASHSTGRLLWKSPDGTVESGIWICTPGTWELAIPKEEVCHFVAGRATYRAAFSDERIEISPGTVVHFHPGWEGTCEVTEPMRVIYMAAPYEGVSRSGAEILRDPMHIAGIVDWGPVPTMIAGASQTSGKLLYRRTDRGAESGIWICTPGLWDCHVTGDELCHFLTGRCTYTHESGEKIEILPDTAAYFPQGWRGTADVQETVRKVYMIR